MRDLNMEKRKLGGVCCLQPEANTKIPFPKRLTPITPASNIIHKITKRPGQIL